MDDLTSYSYPKSGFCDELTDKSETLNLKAIFKVTKTIRKIKRLGKNRGPYKKIRNLYRKGEWTREELAIILTEQVLQWKFGHLGISTKQLLPTRSSLQIHNRKRFLKLFRLFAKDFWNDPAHDSLFFDKDVIEFSTVQYKVLEFAVKKRIGITNTFKKLSSLSYIFTGKDLMQIKRSFSSDSLRSEGLNDTTFGSTDSLHELGKNGFTFQISNDIYEILSDIQTMNLNECVRNEAPVLNYENVLTWAFQYSDDEN